MTTPKPDGLLTDKELHGEYLAGFDNMPPGMGVHTAAMAGLRAVEALVRERIDARRCCECNEPIAPNDWDRRTIALRAAEEIQRAHEDGIDDDPESMAFLLSIIAGAIDQDAANLQSEIDRLRGLSTRAPSPSGPIASTGGRSRPTTSSGRWQRTSGSTLETRTMRSRTAGRRSGSRGASRSGCSGRSQRERP